MPSFGLNQSLVVEAIFGLGPWPACRSRDPGILASILPRGSRPNILPSLKELVYQNEVDEEIKRVHSSNIGD